MGKVLDLGIEFVIATIMLCMFITKMEKNLKNRLIIVKTI